jgi:tRNA-uridine 2-sulfurtransferase
MELKQGDTVIIGMNGDVQSTVTAYLLKKQGFNCIGVTVTYLDQDKDFSEMLSCWLPDSLEHIKEICNALEIPFYATDANDLYKDYVVDNIVAARLGGELYVPQVDKNRVIIQALLNKRDKLGAKVVATGHGCKILKNQTTGSYSLYRGVDDQEDDSYYFCAISPELFQYLLFPLAELKFQEIEKISKLIPVEFKLDKVKRRNERLSFMFNPDLYKFVEKYSPESMRSEGTVYNYYDASSIGDHIGIHQFFIGQKEVPLKFGRPSDRDAEVLRVVAANGAVFMENPEKYSFTHCYLTRFTCDKDLNRSHHINVFVALNPRAELKSCKLYFKNNSTILLEFKEPINRHCFRGQFVAIYNKKGTGGKVIGGAFIRSSGFFDENEGYRTLHFTKEEEEQIEEDIAKKNDLGF